MFKMFLISFDVKIILLIYLKIFCYIYDYVIFRLVNFYRYFYEKNVNFILMGDLVGGGLVLGLVYVLFY